jgi:hypothetical protein
MKKLSTIHEKIVKATQTVNGYKVEDVKFSAPMNRYLGKVHHPNFSKPITGMWDKKGLCPNSNLQDCNLQLN